MKWKIITVIIGIIAPFIGWGNGIIDGKDVCIYLCLLAWVIVTAMVLNHQGKKTKK